MTSIGNTNASLLVNGGVGIGYSSTTQTQNVPQGGLIVNGTVGIGTTNPGTGLGLDVSGTTRTIGFQMTNGAVQGVQKYLGTATSTGVATWTTIPANSWTPSGNNIYNNNSGYIGIGTTSPLHPLDMEGSMNGGALLYVNNYVASGNPSYGVNALVQGTSGAAVYGQATNSYGVWGFSSHSAGVFGSSTSDGYGVWGSSTSGFAGYFDNKVYIGGKVGIGTTNPSDLLTVDAAGSGSGTWMNLMSSTDATAGMTFWGGNGINSIVAPYNSDLILQTQSRQSIQLNHQNNSVNLNAGNILLNARVSINTGNNPADGVDLDVAGTIKAMSVKIGNWTLKAPDYVFDKGYKLPLLKDLEKKIIAEKHLPGLPSAAEMKKNGVDLGEINMALLKKVEELTLYVIDQNKKIEKLEKEIAKKN
jgi:hypothetical protein